MFPGSAFGVDVTVAELRPPMGEVVLPTGETVRPMRLHEALPGEELTDEELAREIQRATHIESVVAAYRAERIVQLASRRPAALDRRPGQPGAASVPNELAAAWISEFFPDELAAIMNTSLTAASVLTDVAATLVTSLPTAWEALASGALDWPRARALAAELARPVRECDPSVVAAVEAAVVPVAMEMSVRALKAAVRRELLSRDAAEADRRRKQAERHADVVLRPAPDGMCELSIFCPQPMGAALRETADTYARMAKETGDPRPLGQLRVGMLADLVLRPWDTSRPPVTACLMVIAPLPALSPARAGQPAGEVDGEPITAAALRELLETLDALCPGGLQAPTGGSLSIALVDPETGALRATVTRPELERLVRRGCTDHPDGGCGCSLLDRPPAVDRYEPTPAQRRFASTRDRTCRHPGCRSRSGCADLDHVVPHGAGGATDCANLCCLCRRHHRLKTHARGWSFVMGPDGVLTVTTPSGVTRTTRPPGLAFVSNYGPAPGSESELVRDPPPF